MPMVIHPAEPCASATQLSPFSSDEAIISSEITTSVLPLVSTVTLAVAVFAKFNVCDPALETIPESPLPPIVHALSSDSKSSEKDSQDLPAIKAVPETLTGDVGSSASLLGMVSVSLLLESLVGEKLMVIVQLVFAAKVLLEQVSLLTEKGDDRPLTLPITRFALPSLSTVIVRVSEEPTSTEPNAALPLTVISGAGVGVAVGVGVGVGVAVGVGVGVPPVGLPLSVMLSNIQ